MSGIALLSAHAWKRSFCPLTSRLHASPQWCLQLRLTFIVECSRQGGAVYDQLRIQRTVGGGEDIANGRHPHLDEALRRQSGAMGAEDDVFAGQERIVGRSSRPASWRR